MGSSGIRSGNSLINALNPNYPNLTQSRLGSDVSPVLHVPQQPQHYIPHRSELELAISEPQPSVQRSRQQDGANVVRELCRIVTATREAQEAENKRRLEWEQRQEELAAQRQAQTESQLVEMRQELAVLKAGLVLQMPYPLQMNPGPMLYQQPASPISPVFQQTTVNFMQGSSQQQFTTVDPRYNLEAEPISSINLMNTPSPSPHLSYNESVQTHSSRSSSSVARKRQSTASSDDDDESSLSDSSQSSSRRPAKRRIQHDTRCQTIHQAMRAHLLRGMDIESDKHLPDSHPEGQSLETTDPVRFVWDKTVKQSVHNNRMKTRILTDLKNNRGLYELVPEKDFGKKTLESVFDQCYSTFRQKYKQQRDTIEAETIKKRDDLKSQNARRLLRRKTKLSERSEARMRNSGFEHIMFDGALQVECMSTDESDCEDAPAGSNVLYSRGHLWRSNQLVRFYRSLDETSKSGQAAQPAKRGVRKKERIPGRPKDSFSLPPRGIGSWMISQRWVQEAQQTHPDLLIVLEKLIEDPVGFDWSQHVLYLLGAENEEETPVERVIDEPQQQHLHYTQSSLQYALS
ncbi:hypothetical protein C8J56DRAFT_1013710 [Mycena floridula]|nr:hypothetical protein C8J56DRAFT_1013710 [Mycena floridula]